MPGVTTLAARLRELRTATWPERPLTQLQLGRVLKISVPLISSWENGTPPPEDRLGAYALLFAQASPAAGQAIAVPLLGQLDEAELARYKGLLRELLALRQRAIGEPAAEPESPLRFPAGQAITIACSEMPQRLRTGLLSTDPLDPDYIESYQYADLDTLLELLPHLAALNPTNPIRFGLGSELTVNDRSAHLIVLGGVDFNDLTKGLLTYLTHVPVKQLPRRTYQDSGGFSVRAGRGRHELLPKLQEEDGRFLLQEDVAHFLRAPNPYNVERTLTFFSGMYSRGSRGVVRALTDPKIKDRNSAYLAERFGGADTYSIVCRVKIVANEIVVPDWTLDEIRLHEWPEAAT